MCVSLKRCVTSQIFNLECYTLDHHYISYLLRFGSILEILRNSRTHGESWGFRYFHISVFSNFENRIICFNYFSLRKYFISKYMRGDKMTSPQIMKYWRKNIKNKYLILFGFYLILFELGKIRFLKISFWAQINVHLVRLIFRGRRKFISGFLESV